MKKISNITYVVLEIIIFTIYILLSFYFKDEYKLPKGLIYNIFFVRLIVLFLISKFLVLLKKENLITIKNLIFFNLLTVIGLLVWILSLSKK